MLFTRAVSAARAFRAFAAPAREMPLHSGATSAARAFCAFAATAREMPLHSDAIAKAAIGADSKVAASFVSAFAPVVHHRPVRVTKVSSLLGTATPVREMKHDISLRYSIGGAQSAVMQVCADAL